MKYYPVNVDVKGKGCLVVGGGSVGSRKVATLLKCGALVTVVSHGFTQKLIDIAGRDQNLTLCERDYNQEDLDGKFLVFVATDNKAINQRVGYDAQLENILCNVADYPEGSNFILPSVVSRGDLTISISTSGSSPAFARQVRQELDSQFGPEYAEFLEIMGAVRKKLLGESHDPETHKKLFEKLLKGGLLELTKAKDTARIDLLLSETLGGDFNHKELVSGAINSGSGKKVC